MSECDGASVMVCGCVGWHGCECDGVNKVMTYTLDLAL